MTPNDPSKPVPLEAEVVEAAAKAMEQIPGRELHWPTYAQAAIHAADEVRGLKAERGTSANLGPANSYRLVSDWEPIKEPVDER